MNSFRLYMSKFTFVLATLAIVSCGTSRKVSTNIDRPYRDTMIASHTVKIDAALWEKDRELTEHTLQHLHTEITAVARVLPEDAFKKLSNVVIWVEAETPNKAPVQYHYSRDWLLSNGYKPEKESSIEIVADDFVKIASAKPYMLVSGFAAAYGQRIAGFSDQSMLAAFGNAKSKNLTRSQRVEDYFTFLSVIYFTEVRDDKYLQEKMKAIDPLGFEMIRSVWKVK